MISYKRTPLMHASIFGQVNAVKFLLQAGADIHATDKNGKTALELARTEEVKNILREELKSQQSQEEGK